MTTIEPPPRRPRARPGRRPSIWRAVLVVAGVVLAFLLGVAFARTLDDRPTSGPTATDVRTLAPLPQGAPDRTVTVTVTTTRP